MSLALVSLLLLSIDRVLLSGSRYLSRTTLITELQQACVMASSRLVTELLESNAGCVRGDSLNQRYVTFGTPRNDKGETTFDPTSGELNWYNIVGYYVAMQGDEPSLFRKNEAISPTATAPPSIPASYDDAYWKGYAQPTRMVAHRVYFVEVVSSTNINVIIGTKSRDGRFLINIKTKLKARN
ncbi:hypothetical protein IV102_32725 [bacterium]|nr:hypothetical protein [bacterium]